MAKIRNAYQKIDLAILSFLNTIRCQQNMILAYYIYKIAFDDKLKCENCCGNYI